MGKWNDERYIIKEKKLTIGRQYYLLDGSENLIGYCVQKMFKLKEDIRVYTGEDKSKELFNIKQEQIWDFSGTFRLKDMSTGRTLGILKREGWISLLKDTWKVLDENRNEICHVEEEGSLAIFRRLFNFLKLFPKTYHFSRNGEEVAVLTQKFQIIGDTWTLNILSAGGMDRKLLVSASLLLDIVEQNRGS